MNSTRYKQSGFGLIELMVAIVIGLIVVGGITSLVVATLRTNTDNYRMTRMTQDLRASMTLISRELRRGGFDRDSIFDFGRGSQTANDFETIRLFDSSGAELDVLVGIGAGNPATCIIFGWDANADGAADAGEFRGFRLDGAGEAIEMKTSGAAADSNCTAGTWQQLTDPALIQVDNFAIMTVGGNPVPTATNIVVRELVVNIQASVTDDPSLEREIEETVRVRNDLLN